MLEVIRTGSGITRWLTDRRDQRELVLFGDDLPCPWCNGATAEDDLRCPSCGRRFG